MQNNIASERVRMSLTQEELAEKMGVSREAISFWETDRQSFSVNSLMRLAEIFGCSTDYLLKITNERLPR